MPKLSITIHLKAPEDWNLNIFQKCSLRKLDLQNQNVALINNQHLLHANEVFAAIYR